ncbi:MAG: MerR family transcriptional regulator [Ktedonobacteraceae bacterium]
MENLYSSGEAREILGVSTSTFKNYVDSGKIRKITPNNRKQGFYVKEDVERVLKERAPFVHVDKSSKRGKVTKVAGIIKTDVDWMKPSDLPAILKLDYIVYKEDIVGDIGLYVSWYRKNPQITFLSFERGNRENVMAYISLVPLPEPVILTILREDRSELSISSTEVETYQRSGGYTLLAESVVTHSKHPEQLNRVMQSVLEFWYERYPDKYIEKIYAQTLGDEGDVLVRKLYFSPLYELSDRAYVLDLRRKGASRIIREFQEKLATKAQQPPL